MPDNESPARPIPESASPAPVEHLPVFAASAGQCDSADVRTESDRPVKPAVTRATTPNWTPVLTVPNVLSGIRLLSVPLFLHLVLVQHQDLLAIAVLVASGISDFLDGWLARAWGQVTRLGQLLDPLADRLYVVSTVVALVLRDIIPLWLALLLVLRDTILACMLLVLRHHGYGPPGVHYLGKAATFALMYGFPLLLLGVQPGLVGVIAAPVAWAFSIWGASLYYWAGGLYVLQGVRLVRDVRRNVRQVPA